MGVRPRGARPRPQAAPRRSSAGKNSGGDIEKSDRGSPNSPPGAKLDGPGAPRPLPAAAAAPALPAAEFWGVSKFGANEKSGRRAPGGAGSAPTPPQIYFPPLLRFFLLPHRPRGKANGKIAGGGHLPTAPPACPSL